MTRAKDISKIVTDANLSGTLNVTGETTLATHLNMGDNDIIKLGASDDLQIYHTGSASVIKDGGSTGIDVTGTVTADGLTVDGNILLETSGNPTITNKTTGAGNNPAYRLQANTNYWDMLGVFSDADDTIRFRYNNTDALKIANNGDISFFEDTGTTASLVWDSSQTQLKVTGRETSRGGGVYAFDLDNSAHTSNLSSAGAMRVKGAYGDSLIVNGLGDVSFFDDSGTAKLFWDSSQEQLFLNGTIDNSTRPQIALDGGSGGSGRSAGISGLASGTNATSLLFFTNADTDIPRERMRIDTSGNVMIGTTSSTGFKMDLNTGGGSGLFTQSIGSGAIGVLTRPSANHNYNAMRFDNVSASIVGTISVGTGSTSYNTTSDYRVKENVVDMTDATTRLKQLQPKRFNFIADADTTVDGFLAHEVQSVVPEAITGTHNEVDADGNPVYQGIDQSKLVPLLVKTIQELEARIVALETA
jgi:hypothetical protein